MNILNLSVIFLDLFASFGLILSDFLLLTLDCVVTCEFAFLTVNHTELDHAQPATSAYWVQTLIPSVPGTLVTPGHVSRKRPCSKAVGQLLRVCSSDPFLAR